MLAKVLGTCRSSVGCDFPSSRYSVAASLVHGHTPSLYPRKQIHNQYHFSYRCRSICYRLVTMFRNYVTHTVRLVHTLFLFLIFILFYITHPRTCEPITTTNIQNSFLYCERLCWCVGGLVHSCLTSLFHCYRSDVPCCIYELGMKAMKIHRSWQEFCR